jgi:Methyl-accepting chemotaxis protein
LTTIQKIIKEVKLGESGYAFLIDTKGRFIAHKDPQKVMKLAIEQDQELGVIADTIMNNSEGSINVALGGQDFRADYLTLASTGWKLVVMTPFAELFSSVSDMIANAIMITLIIIALTVGLIIIYSTSFSREFKQFVDSLGFVAQGDFTRAIEVKTKDEIGQMGAYYNHVLVELRNMVDTIKEKEQHIQFLADREPMTELIQSTEI